MRGVTHATKLLYLYLLSRGRSELSAPALSARLGLSTPTVHKAKQDLRDEHLLAEHTPYVGATSVLEAVADETFKDWPRLKRRKRELPKAVLETPIASRLVWLYLSGVDDAQTLADLAEALDVPYMTVYRGVGPLKPYLDIVGEKPMYLKLAA